VDADGVTLRMDSSREDFTFMKGMSQGLWQKKSDEQTGDAVETRCEHPVVVENLGGHGYKPRHTAG